MSNLKIITFLWGNEYSANNANILKNMVKRNLQIPHEFICITDHEKDLFDKDIRVIPLWENETLDIENFKNLKFKNTDKTIQQKFLGYYYTIIQRKPNCFRRLKLFSEEAKEIIDGEYFLWLDLDCLIVKDFTELIPRNIDFKIWKSKIGTWQPYNGSMLFHKIGTRKELWNEFDINTSPLYAWKSGYQGSDQAWIAHRLGSKEEVWTNKDGVLSFRNDVIDYEIKANYKMNQLPSNTKIVFFHGFAGKPWDSHIMEKYPWVKDNYY
jgi:hypothetical protein